MAISLHTISPAPGSRKQKKRIGRGNASGHGTYSTRGMKGQRARSGGRTGLKRRALKDQYLMRIPKLRGFRSLRPDFAIVSLSALEKMFESGAEITRSSLIKSGLVAKGVAGIKILATGSVSKAFRITVEAISEKAKLALEQAGGTVTIKPKIRVRNVLPKAERINKVS